MNNPNSLPPKIDWDKADTGSLQDKVIDVASASLDRFSLLVNGFSPEERNALLPEHDYEVESLSRQTMVAVSATVPPAIIAGVMTAITFQIINLLDTEQRGTITPIVACGLISALIFKHYLKTMPSVKHSVDYLRREILANLPTK